uniref:swi5-dependent recombination DNA repair protein 1 homolog n=1 Tax=Jaculus jaculus TaxID=51337 RepID=UPI001E1B3A76|nr:swi5-dependent recombination DNA repair protein 1 homolog [Jaculus jaculus]XP_045015826.1 swi5-dependent recombination DNA repair protein 1 homolog [Jaculus jaculus]XP_045015827.1 swi5-dependent recombination DNA repair protein 1 homolog [Jaculus jaculus]
MESPSDSAVMWPSTPQACRSPLSPYTNSSGKQPMSATLRERLKKTRSSFKSFCSVVKRLKVENEENDQSFLEKTASSEENCLEFQEKIKHIHTESEENDTFLKNSCKTINACDSKSFDTGSHSAHQNDDVSKNSKHELNEHKTKLLKQVQEKEDLLRRLKLVKMYRSKNDLSQLQVLIEKWRNCSQLVLCDLQSAMSEENKKLSLTQLIDYYGLDDKLLHYNRSEEEFIDI